MAILHHMASEELPEASSESVKERTAGARVWGGKGGNLFRQTHGPSPVKCRGVLVRVGEAVRSDGTLKAWSMKVILNALCRLWSIHFKLGSNMISFIS